MESNKIYQGHSMEVLKTFPDNSIDCVVTSPPYWGLRDYGNKDQLGLESTPEEFINKLADIFDEVKRVLKDKGTLWLNLGDSYASKAGGYDLKGSAGKNSVISKNTMAAVVSGKKRTPPSNLKPKDLIGIPWMVAFELRKRGWYLRQDIIWHKPNPMPESVTDRCTKSHEYIFLLSKSSKYYYDSDSIKTICKNPEDDVRRITKAPLNGKSTPEGLRNGIRNPSVGGKKHKNLFDKGQKINSFHRTRNENGEEFISEDGKANKRSVWSIQTIPYAEAHFATFPEDLIVDCIKAGTPPPPGIVLDPFMGAGTTALVARKLHRNFIGIELNPEYIKIAEKRLKTELGLFF